jgi:outer membrane protein assembly factor BamB
MKTRPTADRVAVLLGTAGVAWLLANTGAAAPPAAPWRVVEQPALEQALAGAPGLQPEALGEPARGVNVWERWLVPNLDGQSWDVLQIYFKEYYGPTWLYALDLGTGQVKRQRLADGHQFYLSGRALGFDGKYYIATPSRQTWSMDLFVYDPASNTLEERGEIVRGLGGEVRPLVTGPDGRIYGTGTRGNQVGLYIYDPKLGKVVKDFGPVGPRHPNGAWSRYVMGVDDTHAYIASGMIPAWYLVAVKLATGEEQVLLESPTEQVMDILERFPGAIARVPQGAGRPDHEYWLHHGQATLMTNSAPPWTAQLSPWDKAVPKPEVYFDQIDPDENGNAVLWHRSRAGDRLAKPSAGATTPEAPGWKSIRLEDVPAYPHRINPLSVLPDGRLYGTGEDYVGTFLFDPKTDHATYCGPRVGLAPYTTIVSGGQLYLSGYSGGHLFVFDPARPWTLGKGGPPGQAAPDQGDARSNPRYLGDFDKTTRVGLMHSSALGADGRIYFGGFGLRHYTGGGFGWYDPKERTMGGFWESLSGYAVQWIAPALAGRLIVISTIRAADELNGNRVPEAAKLFLYDVHARGLVRALTPLEKGHTTGLIVEAMPGRLLGLTSQADQRRQSLLYGVDLTTGETLFTKSLPSPVSVDAHWPHWVDPSYEYHAFARGPDGFVWTWLKDVLVRIDPGDASVHVVGRVTPVGWPTFVGDDLYLSGSEPLRRIRGITRGQRSGAAVKGGAE